MKKTILFDLDGTLLDTLKDLTIAVNYMLTHYNRPHRTEQEVRSFLGNGAMKLIELSYGEALTKEALKEVYDYYDAYYQAHSMVYTKPYNGILELLSYLRSKGYQMAVISNKQDAAVKALVDLLFPNLFELSVGVKADQIKKPDPRMIESVLKELNATRENTILIGDSEVDIMTGKNANVDVIACLWGFRDMKEIAPLKPEFIVSNPLDIKKIL